MRERVASVAFLARFKGTALAHHERECCLQHLIKPFPKLDLLPSTRSEAITRVGKNRGRPTAATHACPSARMLSLLLRVSRPYYYLVTLWLYLMPTGGHYELLTTPTFWLGFAYCTLPLNLLCYWMNDLADVAVDRDNARKGGHLLGAKENAARLRSIGYVVALMQPPFLIAFSLVCGARIWPWFGGVVLVNWLYNFGPQLSSGRHAPLDLACPCGYLLVVYLGSWLNGLPPPPSRSWAHAALLVVRTQVTASIIQELPPTHKRVDALRLCVVTALDPDV